MLGLSYPHGHNLGGHLLDRVLCVVLGRVHADFVGATRDSNAGLAARQRTYGNEHFRAAGKESREIGSGGGF